MKLAHAAKAAAQKRAPAEIEKAETPSGQDIKRIRRENVPAVSQQVASYPATRRVENSGRVFALALVMPP